MSGPAVVDAPVAVKLVGVLTNEAASSRHQQELDSIIASLEPRDVSMLLQLARSHEPGKHRLCTSGIVSMALGLSRGIGEAWSMVDVFSKQLVEDDQIVGWFDVEADKILADDQDTPGGLTTWIESHMAWGWFVGRRFVND